MYIGSLDASVQPMFTSINNHGDIIQRKEKIPFTLDFSQIFYRYLIPQYITDFTRGN